MKLCVCGVCVCVCVCAGVCRVATLSVYSMGLHPLLHAFGINELLRFKCEFSGAQKCRKRTFNLVYGTSITNS